MRFGDGAFGIALQQEGVGIQLVRAVAVEADFLGAVEFGLRTDAVLQFQQVARQGRVRETPAGIGLGRAAGGIARDLRQAYVGGSAEDRLGALKGLWDEPTTADGKFARLVLTARAAARIRPTEQTEDVDRLVASMLTAGLDRAARRWLGVAKVGGDAWAMLMLAEPRGAAVTYAQVDDYDGNAAKKRMLFAGLAGLGRMDAGEVQRGADDLGLNLAGGDAWSRAIDAAARADQPGTVVLLCAAGMQTADWRGVDPAMLFRMIAALRATGLEGYGRMIAAEAIARLPA